MMNYLTFGILAHVDAGKTTLSEGLLYTAGRLREIGRVDNGNAFLDNYELERARGITIFSKQAVLSWKDTHVTLLDTPGHVDFSAEMERTLQVLDYAVLVISGADGVQGHTRTLWQLLDRYRVPVFLFVNKMDQPGTDREALLGELQSELDGNIVDFTEEGSASFFEELSLCGEELLEEFLESDGIDTGHIQRAIGKREIFPCFFGSALKLAGVENFCRGLEKYAVSRQYPDEFGAKVFKITRDGQGNRLTYVKVTGGSIRARMELSDADGTWREKVNQIRVYSGEKYETRTDAPAGMVCALTGLTKTYPGQGLGAQSEGEAPFLAPVLTYRVLLPEECEAAVMLPKLRELEEEEPELHVVWNEELQEIQVQVMGEVQIEILQSLIAERYGEELSFDSGNIVYKETIQNTVEGVGHFEPLRHYAEVHLLMEPGEPGSGFQTEVRCSEDILDRNWQRLVLTHLTEREHRGVLTGSPITDMRVTLIAGRAHLKHTEGGDFREATYRALRQGLMQAESVLLEPWYEFRLELPETAVGRAMTDIERMSGVFQMEQGTDKRAVLTGSAPVAAMRGYAGELAAYAKGEGRLSCRFLGYLPCHNAEEVIAESGYDPDRDVENPSGSVFCSHGAGVTVSWDHVKEHMHVDSGFRPEEDAAEETKEDARAAGPVEDWIDVEEIDRILEKTAHANRKMTPVSHKGISGKRPHPMKPSVGLSKPKKKQEKKGSYLLVDGYNIIFAWEELRVLAKTGIDAARGRLMDILCNYQGFKKCELILVFDAYRVQNHRTETMDYHNIHVVYTKEAETADAYIERFAHENASKYHVTVATSDGLEQIIIRGAGCRLMSANEFHEEIVRAGEQMREFM